MSVYLITFDPDKTDASALHAVIKGSSNVRNWWHYIKSCYIIISNSSLQTISKEITAKWPKQRFLIVSANLTEHNGWLPQEAWDWINKYK